MAGKAVARPYFRGYNAISVALYANLNCVGWRQNRPGAVAVVAFRSYRAVHFMHRVAHDHREFSACKGTYLLGGFGVIAQMDSMAEITGSVRFLISPAVLERIFAAANVVALTA
jgi:hypothetical protein